jgi:ubiquinone/menaquinone biosynthesis C-methylase UbiE
MAAAQPEYVLGRSPQEYARLTRQGELFRPMTRRLFEDAGIELGMRVLDLGCGAGDVAMLAAEMVGPTGAVIGVDVDPIVIEFARERVAEHDFRNIRFAARDISEYELSEEVDAVVGRLVLMYQRDPAAVLAKATRHLRRGGAVAFIEPLFMPMAGPDSTLRRTGLLLIETLRRSGAHLDLALRLHKVFEGAGLPLPQMRFEAIVDGAPDSPLFQYLADTVANLLPNAIEYGIATAEEVQIETLAERIKTEMNAAGYAMVVGGSTAAWCRKL